MTALQPYEQFARFYDALMPDAAAAAGYIRNLIVNHHSRAKTLLELGCGTGAILKFLSENYSVTGLDISPHMLAHAREQLPEATFFEADMVTCDLGVKFDVIICVFDSIQHVLSFTGWLKVFRKAVLHLEADGLFLLDVTTKRILRNLILSPASVKELGNHVLIMDVRDAGGGIANWNIKVFAPEPTGLYRLFEENIQEVAFPLAKIRTALLKQFDVVKALDPTGQPASEESTRVYFLCRKRENTSRRARRRPGKL
ncbi:methyltransferase domain-containing protein [Sinorhizobium meliloti]|nr:methyltransferase domain-containing protein [Sinorhizobium meliloti]MDW9514662.1 methyltransferase domain-containing protein [Sinorhizobium meliloti]MDW9893742.1 methyltransferase domain-containing protein [Sinorhizobium meliloti]MDX0097800.1 methyltransferase domain-containing protein [Sinorhizobium meliloti]MDX0378229.1 methyltransferase domain-containing protein [Sinorhizobium meliloti]